MSKPVKHLVVDSSAFIRNAPLKDLTDTVYCVDGVVAEIKDANTLMTLQVLPFDFKLKQPSSDSIKFVSNFSKKTGDYYNLSAVDLQLLALTYQLAKENLTPEEFSQIKLEPTKQQPIIDNGKLKLEKPVSIAGFYLPKKESDLDNKLNEDNESSNISDGLNSVNLNEKKVDESQQDINNDENNNVQVDGDEKHDSDSGEQEESEGENKDDEGWITPKNLEKVRMMDKVGADQEAIDNVNIAVGCITSDFSMQNVLIQLGIPVLSVDGLLIKKARSYVLKCTGCLKVTTNMSKQFCPNCSYKTLVRVLVIVDSNGNKIYKERRKPLSTKGLRFSLPMPTGGKHSNYPILSEDQPRPQNLPSKKALIKNNPLDPDYTCQSSPFVTKDIYSRASRLGIKSAEQNKISNRFIRRK